MHRYGYSLMSETKSPTDLVRDAVAAEEAGFDFLTISDHIHPWLESHGHSGFAWSTLGAIAHATERIQIATMVTCPILRYHPVIVAQAAGTIGVMSGGRFVLGLGAGERLNEHVVGLGWPAVDTRHEMLGEAVEIIQQLFEGGRVTYRGAHLDAEEAKVYDLPDDPIEIFVAAAGPEAAAVAAGARVGVCNTIPDAEVIDAFLGEGGEAQHTWAQVVSAWASTEERGRADAHEIFRFAAPGWKVQAELPDVANFEAATQTVRPEDLADAIPAGPDPAAHAATIGEFHDAGYRNVAIAYPGDDIDGFFRFWTEELRPTL